MALIPFKCDSIKVLSNFEWISFRGEGHILSSEEQLRHVLTEYLQYYHHERIHQGIDRIIEPKYGGNDGEIVAIERLGGLLKSYHHKAA